MGYSYCRFQDCSAPETSMGTGQRTDGTWVWPEGFVHYVDAHDIALPPAFLEYVLDGTPIRQRGVWVRWSAGYRSQLPDASPAALADVRALTRALMTPTFAPSVDEEGEWWLVRNGDVIVDQLRPKTLASMEVYLHARRTVPQADCVDVRAARSLLRADGWKSRVRDVIARRRVENHNGQPILFEGTSGVGLAGCDEAAIRYRKRIAAEDGEPFNSALASRFARLWC